MTQQVTAVVDWFNESKGYGFLRVGDEKVFVHYTSIYGDGYKILAEGELVECEIIDGPKGPQAINVVKVPYYAQ